jgi:hypothetical protein
MKNIHVLPTDKPSRVFITKDEGLGFDNQMLENTELDCQNQHIYITNDEEIKEGDWWLNIKTNDVDKCTYKSEVSVYNSQKYQHIKKIILTTDQDLIKDGVQAIDDEFSEWFVKNPSCESVEVEKDKHLFCSHCNELYSSFSDGVNCDVCRRNSKPYSKILSYKIIIRKEELHSMDDEVECNMCGDYMYLLPDNSIYVCTNSECTRCYEEDEEPKQDCECTDECLGYLTANCKGIEQPKQETLEEAVDRASLLEFPIKEWYRSDYYTREEINAARDGFKRGAKWQAERMYSEEEVRNIVEQTIEKFYKHRYVETKSEMKELWFEQFKKK